MNKKIIIIGGAGFIGHNLAIKLKENNFDVSIIDGLEVNNLTSIIGNYDNLPYPLLSKKIVDSRLNLLSEKKIPLYVQDARNYHSLSSHYLKNKTRGYNSFSCSISCGTI